MKSVKNKDIETIYRALTTLGNKQLPIAWQIAKNIKRVEAAIKELQELLKVVNEKYALKKEAIDFAVFILACKASAQRYGNIFDRMLLESDFDGIMLTEVTS